MTCGDVISIGRPSAHVTLSIRSLAEFTLSAVEGLGISPGGSDAAQPAQLHSFRVLCQRPESLLLQAISSNRGTTSCASPGRQASSQPGGRVMSQLLVAEHHPMTDERRLMRRFPGVTTTYMRLRHWMRLRDASLRSAGNRFRSTNHGSPLQNSRTRRRIRSTYSMT